ncbi:MAG: phosphoglucosamine mutase [Pseudomonadota bacterium]
MKRRYFGTDGIRGRANARPMSADIALKVGMAAGRVFRRGDHRHRVVIGKDTRLSGYMVEPALTAGFAAVGMDVFLFGPLPTPAVAMLTRSLRADLGVMISASHNSYEDNGVKLFGPDGYKLSDETELAIERLMEDGYDEGLVGSADLGRVKRVDDALARYIEFAKNTFPRDLRLDTLRIVVDCANGAAYKAAPTVLWELGAEVIPLGVAPDGFNINQECGSTFPRAMCEAVRQYRADIGLALDGDADRVLIADERGELVDGDQLLALIAKSWLADGRLRGGGVASTIMANLGFERFLGGLDLNLLRAKVGDRYVVEAMRQSGMNVGGEPSGHIILNDFATTGDGLVAALQALAVIGREGKPVSEACALFEAVPQIMKSVRYKSPSVLDDAGVKAAIKDGEARLEGLGRLVIRKSGTEPVVRVMAEGDDAALVASVVDGVVDRLHEAAKT